MPKPKDPCKVFACRIQQCLQEHNYQESACKVAIKELEECCMKWTNSFVCQGIKVDKTTVKNDQ